MTKKVSDNCWRLFYRARMVTYWPVMKGLGLMVDHQPDLVLMDVKMPVMDSIRPARMKSVRSNRC